MISANTEDVFVNQIRRSCPSCPVEVAAVAVNPVDSAVHGWLYTHWNGLTIASN